MAESDPARKESELPSRPLSKGQRRTSIVLGVLTLGAGAVGSFLDGTNSIGIPALVVIGAALTYVGITGQTLTRVKIGDNELALAKQIVTDESAPDNLRVAAAEVLEETDVPLARTTKRAVEEVLGNFQSGRDYEVAVINEILANLPKGTILSSPEGTPERNFIVETTDGGQSIAVEIRYIASTTAAEHISRRIRDLRARTSFFPVNARLMITNAEVPERTMQFLRLSKPESERIGAVTWRGSSDTPQLADALNEMIRPQEGHESG
ncbi:hypothetical protein [Kribbella sp. NPDC048928]|uniref:hypothetical protein n=1 Tax=Kribbella sp. NPDC048928 TaxID=3364111 RepID=UPI00371963FF